MSTVRTRRCGIRTFYITLYHWLKYLAWNGRTAEYRDPRSVYPQGRRKVLFGRVRPPTGEIFHGLARQKEYQIIEGHLEPEHVHMHICIAVPPKVTGGFGGRVPEREEGYCGCPTVWARAELHGRAPAGPGLCRLDGRVRPRSNPSINCY